MEREFGALKGLMGVNGLTGVDIVPDLGIGTTNVCSDGAAALTGCAKGCETSCYSCAPGCVKGGVNGKNG